MWFLAVMYVVICCRVCKKNNDSDKICKLCHLHGLIAKLLVRCSVFAWIYLSCCWFNMYSGAKISAHAYCACSCGCRGIQDTRSRQWLIQTEGCAIYSIIIWIQKLQSSYIRTHHIECVGVLPVSCWSVVGHLCLTVCLARLPSISHLRTSINLHCICSTGSIIIASDARIRSPTSASASVLSPVVLVCKTVIYVCLSPNEWRWHNRWVSST